jgi:fumarylacetoacetate (FAA) hydrolase
MKLVRYTPSNIPHGVLRPGRLDGDRVFDLVRTFAAPEDMTAALAMLLPHAEIWSRPIGRTIPLSDVRLAAPLMPHSLRDFSAFEEDVKSVRTRRKVEMVSEWYEFPVFYFANPHAIFGPGDVIPYPKRTQQLDFELEVAAVIGKQGRDIPAEVAESYVVGYTIMNDWSARDILAQEMKVGLGPAKGKDFATSLGPWIITPDELKDRRSEKGYDLEMIARRNGSEISHGNWKTIHYSFADMIARASEDVTLYPGDVIGSGTVGTGCILEAGPDAVGGWLKPGDTVELEVERLGTLANVIGEPAGSNAKRSG